MESERKMAFWCKHLGAVTALISIPFRPFQLEDNEMGCKECLQKLAALLE